MARRRSRLQIYLDVLKVVASGVHKPTQIMYKCNLSWVPLKEILNSLVDRDLIRVREVGKRRVYEITEKGWNVIRYFDRAFKEIGKLIHVSAK